MRTSIFCLIVLMLLSSAVYAGDLARIYIAPGDVGLVAGGVQQFRIIGEDIDGNEVTVPGPVSWSVDPRVGTISSTGTLTAGYTPGRYWNAVSVTASSFSDTSNVEVYSEEQQNGWVINRSIGSLFAGRVTSPVALDVDAEGNLYVVDSGTSSVCVFGPNGGFLHAFPLNQSISGMVAMAISPNHDIYILDTDLCSVQVYNRFGAFIRQWGSSGTAAGQFVEPEDIAVGSDGRVYVADSGSNRVHIFSSSGTYCGEHIIYDNQNSLPVYRLYSDQSGSLYVKAGWPDYAGYRLYEINTGGQFFSFGVGYDAYDVFAQSGSVYVLYISCVSRYYKSGFSYNFSLGKKWSCCYIDGSAVADYASSMAVDSLGRVYVLDRAKFRVTLFDSDGDVIRSIGQPYDEIGDLNKPVGCAVDSTGALFVADSANKRVQKFSTDGMAAGEFSSLRSHEQVFSCTGGVTIGSTGFIYLTDSINNRMLGYTTSGSLLINSALPTDGVTEESPAGIVSDSGGSLYIVDSSYNKIYKLNSIGGLVATWGSTGNGQGQFNTPFGITRDSSNNLYVADFGNNRIQKLSQSGSYLAGWGASGSGNGQFNGPAGVCASGSNIYAVDQGNCRVQKFTTSGSYISKLGTKGYGRYQFFDPEGITIDSQGRMYVADTYNNRLMVYSPYTSRPIAISISSPTASDTYDTDLPSVNISGGASASATSVTWANDRGGSGTCSGTSTWSASVQLSMGENVISVAARDSAGNTATDSIIVTCKNAGLQPTISITSPTSDPKYDTTSSVVSLGGSASDVSGIARVEWFSNRGYSGVCTGTTSWSVAGIPVASGPNVITVVAVTNTGLQASDSIIVSDPPPTISITYPTDCGEWIANSSPILIRGVASDNDQVTQVKWSRSGSSDTCTGTTDWSASIPVSTGQQYIYITAYDSANQTTTAKLNVVYTTAQPKSIAQVKSGANSYSTMVYLKNKVVTAIFDESYYVQEPDGYSAIRVINVNKPAWLSVGDKIDLAGYLCTGVAKERYIYVSVETLQPE